jgi:hypothetical protein
MVHLVQYGGSLSATVLAVPDTTTDMFARRGEARLCRLEPYTKVIERRQCQYTPLDLDRVWRQSRVRYQPRRHLPSVEFGRVIFS